MTDVDTPRCLDCGHPPCAHCKDWCDELVVVMDDGEKETMLCCGGQCRYEGTRRSDTDMPAVVRRWAEEQVAIEHRIGPDSHMTRVARIAELLSVNHDSWAIQYVGPFKRGKHPYGRTGLTEEEARELHRYDGALEAFERVLAGTRGAVEKRARQITAARSAR